MLGKLGLLSSAVLVFLVAACSDDASVADGPIAQPDASALPDSLPDALPRTMTEATLSAQRSACAFAKGARPAETLGKEIPIGDDIPIKHIVVIMQENRSFDHYLGRLVAQGYYDGGDFSVNGTGLMHSDQLDGTPADFSNPDGDGGVVVPHPDSMHCYSVNHGWDDMHADYDGGKNDGFVINNNPGGEKTFTYQDDTVIPFYYAVADKFAVGDRYFASVLTSTYPNRLFLMAGTSFGIGDNSFVEMDTKDSLVPQIFLLLQAAGRTWKDYTDTLHQQLFFPGFGLLLSTQTHLGNVKCDLMNDIAGDKLPDVAFVMGDEVSEFSDEGPPALPAIGGLLVEEIVRAIFASPAWKDTVVFITYDENGGLADHVPPAPACPPDGFAPHDQNGHALAGAFDTTGFRVPFIVISPYARPHFVSHVVHDHTSITRFIETRFGLPALTARDANATPPMEMFDFENAAFATPPDIIAHTTVDPDVLAACHQALTPTCEP
jgi:phospholipase C